MDKSWFQKSKDVAWLKELYFQDEDKVIKLKKGEILLEPNSYNDRLFLICEGRLKGYIGDIEGGAFEIFSSSKDMFVGVYSFFSIQHLSYSTVRADEDTELRYIERSQSEVSEPEFAQHFLPVVVNEIYLRQLVAHELSIQRQAAIRKLAENEKMSTLGQLAAGIAHELNNAIGVVQRNTEWLSIQLGDYFKIKDPELLSFYSNSLEKGQKLSSSKIRVRRKEIEKKFNLGPKLAKQLAKSNADDAQIVQILKEGSSEFESMQFFMDIGLSLHDMTVASNQASHVVRSVRDLGNAQKIQSQETEINETIRRAITLTTNLLLGVKWSFHTEADGVIIANPGDLVQVWLNLIKNACESLRNSQTESPELLIRTWEKNDTYFVSITDNGPGIEEELLPTIFQPNVTTKVDGLSFGLGLGLSILKKIIESYNGNVSVTSRPGKTCFTVELPKPN
jgi:signal transduction histidine kinase